MSSGLVVVLGSALLVDAAVRGRWDIVLHAIGPIALVVWAVWLLVLRPSIRVETERLTVVNPMRITTMSWGSVADIRLRYQIVVETTERTTARTRRVTCWGGPTLPRPKPARRGERPTMPTSGELTVLLDTWAVAQDRGAADGPVLRTWDRIALLTGGVAVALVAVSVFS